MLEEQLATAPARHERVALAVDTRERDELAAAGGAVAFMTAWLNREALTKRYQKTENRWRQGDLLDRLALDKDERGS